MNIYKGLRGLLKASALTTVMFVMQACYGSPKPKDEMNKLLDDYEKAIDKADDCDELMEASVKFSEKVIKLDERNKADSTDILTKEEKEELSMRFERVNRKRTSKMEELGCE